MAGSTAPRNKRGRVSVTASSSSSSSSSSSPQPSNRTSTKRTKTISTDTLSVAPVQISRLSAEHAEWPARSSDIHNARAFLQRAARAVAEDGERILLVPDKDADGLSAGCIVKRTLLHLGANADRISVHHIPGAQAPSTDERLAEYGARWIVVLDQGSGAAPPLVSGAERGWQSDDADAVRTMVLDHHHVADLDRDGPQGALVLNASHHKPVCTSALLAWCVCRPLWPSHDRGGDTIDYLALIGTAGDLSVNVAWDAPWPDFAPEMKRWGKSRIGQAVALINAPRRTPEHDAVAAWEALNASTSPLDILDASKNPTYARLAEARRLVAAETEKQTHTPPKFSKDSRVALLTIATPYQVHPSIATRWSGTLKGAKRLQVVMCANTAFGAVWRPPSADGDVKDEDEDGGHDEVEAESEQRFVHFSCRIANAAKARGENPNIIELLHDYAARDPTFLSDLYASGGQGSFARGHREASGGILAPPFWKRFVELMQIGVKATPPPEGEQRTKNSPKKQLPAQNNKLTNYFTKAA